MGKSKKRIIYKGKNEQFTNITRDEAVRSAVELLSCSNKEAYAVITLFGLSAEELLEGGASYETVKGLGNILK
jgi:hypothetical protein